MEKAYNLWHIFFSESQNGLGWNVSELGFLFAITMLYSITFQHLEHFKLKLMYFISGITITFPCSLNTVQLQKISTLPVQYLTMERTK